MKISIITSSLNSEKTIEKTIKSVISQEYPDIEYILIDGGSTDHTMDIVEKYRSHFAYIVSEKDRGIADGFNKGIMRATGDIVGIINTDDIMLSGVAKKLADIYDENTDIYYGDHIVIDKENDTECYHKANPLNQLKFCLPFSHQSVYITKKCYEKFGLYSLEYKICMDYDLIRKMHKNGAVFKYIPMALCEFSYGGASYVNPLSTVNECMSIAMKYGLSKREADIFKTKYLLLAYGRKLLINIGLLRFGQSIRQIFNKRLIYK